MTHEIETHPVNHSPKVAGGAPLLGIALRRSCSRARPLGLVAMLALSAGALACGGGGYEVQGTDQAIGADGRVEVESTDHGNRMVDVKLEHLPPPARLAGGSQSAHYVVWLVPSGDQSAEKAGYLDYDPDSRKGRLATPTTLDDFRVLVTVEKNRRTSAPTGTVIIDHQVRS